MRPDKPARPYRVYDGVRIYRVKTIIPGSDFRIDEYDEGVPCKPQYEISYRYAGSYPYRTLAECKDSIDKVKTATLKYKIPDDMFREVMNTETGELLCR